MSRVLRLALLLAPACLMLLGGCSEESAQDPSGTPISVEGMLAPAGGVAPDPDGVAAYVTITGTAGYYRYEPLQTGLSGYRVFEVCPFVTVQAASHRAPHAILMDTQTDELGRYSLNFITTEDFYIRVFADMGFGTRVVVSASTGFPLVGAPKPASHFSVPQAVPYAVTSPIIHRAQPVQTVNVYADTDLPYMRSGAFSILGTLFKCLRGVQAAGGLALLPQQLNVVWAPGNLGKRFSFETGGRDVVATVPGTAFLWLGDSDIPYLLVAGGEADAILTSDHDEFDDAVIAHEFGHFLIYTTSRNQNWGGPHAGQSIVPNAAYSEGAPTAIGCALLGDRNYIDTRGLPPFSEPLFSFDCENPFFVPGVIGYDAEFSVTAVIWDLLDGPMDLASTDGEYVSVALPQFFNGLFNLATRDEIIWLPSLLQQLVDDGFLTTAEADLLVSAHGESFPPVPDWPEELTLTGISGTLDASTGPNGTPPNAVLGTNANGIYRFEVASAGTILFRLQSIPLVYFDANNRLELFVYDLDGNEVFSITGPAQDKTTSILLQAGVYMVRVHHAASSPQPTNFILTAN